MQLVIDGNTRDGTQSRTLPSRAVAAWIDSSKQIQLAAITSDGI